MMMHVEPHLITVLPLLALVLKAAKITGLSETLGAHLGETMATFASPTMERMNQVFAASISQPPTPLLATLMRATLHDSLD